VVVHRAALSALQEADLPDQFLDDAIRRVSYVVRAHSDGDRSDVLALALEVWLGLLRHTNRVTPAVQTVAVKLLRKLQPYDAKDFIRHGWGGLREATGYADFVVDLLEHPGTFDTSYDDLIEELGAIPSVEIQRLGKRIVEAGMTISSREPWRSGECLQVLAEAKVWDAAKELAHRRVEACGNTRDFHSRRLDAELGEAIVKLESAAAEGVVDDVVRHAGRARELQHEIARDEEDNKDVRGLFAPTRRPSTDG